MNWPVPATTLLLSLWTFPAEFSVDAAMPRTRVSIADGRWHINGEATYRGANAEGLLLNVRMVNATFEDRNRPDFDAEANSEEFIARIPDYVAHGVRAFTLSLQGGMPGYEGAANSAFETDGVLRDSYLRRVGRVIEACDRHGAVVILGCYYQRQDQVLKDEKAVRAGVVNVVKWIQANGFSNVVLEIANEFGHGGFDHASLKSAGGQVDLIWLARQTAPSLLVSTSSLGDGTQHESVARSSDFLLVHFNSTRLEDIPRRIAALKKYSKPIVCNEDQKLGEPGAKAAALCVANGASWGLMLEKLNQHFPFTFQGATDDPVVYAALKQLASSRGSPDRPNSQPTAGAAGDEEFNAQLERLRKESPGEFDKVQQLIQVDREAATQFLRKRFSGTAENSKKPAEASKSRPTGVASARKQAEATPLPPRTERFTKIETLSVGEFSVDLCRREDGAFGLGEIRRRALPLRRADFLITWQVEGKFPVFQRREGLTIRLQEPSATVTFTPDTRDSAGTRFAGLRMRFEAGNSSILETASWELGGSTRDLSYFDGYRGWHAPPRWLRADAVPPTNPKLTPSLLAGTGFQLEHGPDGALLHFHTSPGDALRNASRGEALEFETSFHGSSTVERFILVATGDSRLNLWTRAYEVAHAELRRVFGLPEPVREIFLQWPPFSRKGFRETARQCAAVTAREGFTGASIDVIWDNADFHGGAKNMNVWDYTICEGYGGEAGLRELMDACEKQNLRVMAWLSAGHLWSQSPVWKAHPEWILLNARGEKFVNPAGGIWHGALDSGFHDYWRDRVVDVVRRFGMDGLWLDTHLSYAQQSRSPDHGARLAAIYAAFMKAGARHLLVEGDASAFGSYAIAIGDDWGQQWGNVPDPDLYYGAMLAAGSMDLRFYRANFRRYVAAGAPWILNWDFLFSQKLNGPEFDAARREVRQVLQDYRRVKDRMIHRFVHRDGSGYTWTNDRDGTKVVWLLRDAPLPDGRGGIAGQVYEIQ